MSTTVVTPKAEEVAPAFDPKAFMAKQNEAQQAKLTGKGPAKPADKPADANAGKPTTQAAKPAEGETPGEGHEETNGPRLSRSQRREHNRLLTELGEARGRAKALEEMLAKGIKPGETAKPEAAADSADPKPIQANFSDHNEYLAALASWSGRQEASKIINKKTAETEQEAGLRAQIDASATKAEEDMKGLADWDVVMKAAQDDGPEFIPAEHPNLMGLLATSDMRAFVAYHFAKHPEELEKMLELSKNPNEQIRQFHRLEGRMERLYAKDSAAQATETPKGETQKADSKDRTTNPENAEQARETQAEAKPPKPKPSSEVAARGSSSAPEEPAVGSAAWMMRRNQTERGR